MSGITISPLIGIGQIQPGDNLAALLLHTLDSNQLTLAPGDVIVVAQKIISKAENRYRNLQAITPSSNALELAQKTHKDPRLVALVLEESIDVIRACPGILITRHRSGFVMANAGIDASNLPHDDTEERVLLWPKDPDASAAALRTAVHALCGIAVSIVISDSFGRPWRNGVTNVAIGAAGFPSLLDRRNEKDLSGRALQVTQVALGDLVASAAGLLMGEGAEGIPAALLSGLPPAYSGLGDKNCPASSLVRPIEEDLFR